MSESDLELGELRLLHLADSALPIGGLAHSFGLESLVAHGLAGVSDLTEFLRGFLEEAGLVEAVFCREGFRLASGARSAEMLGGAAAESARERPRRLHGLKDDAAMFAKSWVGLNDRLSAMKPARESRMGSASLGKNFLAAVAGLGDFAMRARGAASFEGSGELDPSQCGVRVGGRSVEIRRGSHGAGVPAPVRREPGFGMPAAVAFGAKRGDENPVGLEAGHDRDRETQLRLWGGGSFVLHAAAGLGRDGASGADDAVVH